MVKKTSLYNLNFFFVRKCPKVGLSDPDEHFQVVQTPRYHSCSNDFYHILLHVLGKYHEHQRPDRDQYIRVNWDNIITGNLAYNQKEVIVQVWIILCIQNLIVHPVYINEELNNFTLLL